MSGIEWLAASLGVLSVWLTARQNIWCWPIGLIMVLLYTWIFFDAKLYASMLLQGFFAATQVYGWWNWQKYTASDSRPKRLSRRHTVLGLAAGAVGSLLLAYLLGQYTDTSQPAWDASLTAFSLVAQLWMARKYLQCWPLWCVVDVLYVGLFINQNLMPTALLYGVFVLLALHGWRSWHQALK